MTIDDEIQLLPATTGDGNIVPEGRYTLHLIRIEKAPPSDFKPEDGPRIKWIFNLYDAQHEPFFFDGKLYEFFRHTSRKNSPRAFARKYAEALLGRALAADEVPPLSSLLGRRMSALLSYEDSENKPGEQVLRMSSFKHVASDPTPSPAATAPKPAPGQVSADPSDDEIDRALTVSKIQKSLKRLKALDAEAGAAAQKAVDASDLEEALLDDLNALADEISAAVMKAMQD